MVGTIVAVALLTASAVFGQAAVESAIITGAGASGTAGAARGLGKSVGAIFDRANATLDRAKDPDDPKRKLKTNSAAAVAKPPTNLSAPGGKDESIQDLRSTVSPEDVHVGMPREELLALAGTPSLRIRQSGKELLTFTLKSGGSIDVIVADDKVTGVKFLP